MAGYTKLSSTLVASSIWNEPDKTRIVWITLLALADQNGDVRCSLTSLAHLSRESVQDTKDALETLLSPDPESGRPDLEGRRVVVIEGGWHLVTHPFYREQGMSNEARTYWREKKRVYRAKSKTVKDKSGKSQTLASASVLVSVQRKRVKREKPTSIEMEEYAQEINQPRSDGSAMFLHFEDNGWPKNWRLKLQKWKAWGYLPSQKQGSNGHGRVVRQMSAFEIDKRKQAITDEINATFKRNGNRRVEGDGIDELKKRRDELQKSLLV